MINQLWDKIIQTSKNLKQQNQNFDGLKFWNSFKQELKNINEKISSQKIIWNYQSHDVLRMSFNNFINDISVDKDDEGNLIEWKHFIRQILWIPHKDNGEFSFHRLMQIALNYGQLLGSLDKISNAELKAKVISEGLFLRDITKYISSENLIKINLTQEEFNSINDILEEHENAVNVTQTENSINITQTENVTTESVETEVDEEEVTTAQMSDTSEVLSSDVQSGGYKRYYISYK